MKKILLSAYLNKNLGDDLFVKILTEKISNASFIAIPSTTYTRIFKNVYFRYNLFVKLKNKLHLRSYIRHANIDAHVVLGGSMFIEQNEPHDELIRRISQEYKKDMPLFIIGSNFGPYKNAYYREEYKKIFANAIDVCFREKYSANLFKDLKNIRIAPDVVFGLDTEKYDTNSKKKVVISVIDLASRDGLAEYKIQYERKVAEIADFYTKNNYEVVLMSFCGAEGDEHAIKSISLQVNNPVRTYFYNGNIDEALNEIASSELVIGTRFHSIVLGLVFDKKVLPIIYSDKTLNLLSDVKYNGSAIEIKNIDKLEVTDIDKISNKLKNISSIKRASGGQFSALEKFLEEDK